MEQSLKFKILFECKRIRSLSDFVLPIETLSASTPFPMDTKSVILRSALIIENTKVLNSGIGLSIIGINDKKTFDESKSQILSQSSLDYAIMQPCIEHEFHLTVFSTAHFDFVESVGCTPGTKSGFDFINDKTLSSKKPFLKALSNFLRLYKKEFSGEYILELGFSKSRLYLYQANDLKGKNLDESLYSSILKRSLLLNQQLKKNSFLNHLRIEKRAHVFRLKGNYTNVSDCLDNWLYIFFYFKLFCIKNKRSFSQDSFELFLNTVNSKVHLSKMLKRHLEISSLTNEIFEFNINTVFSESKEIYIGSGEMSGIIDESILVSESLDPKTIKEMKPSLVISSYDSLLGHPALICAELGIPLIGGLASSVIHSISLGDNFSVDFKLKQFTIKYSESL
jgi:phosphohistidine swiveling domain-containing protein